jgi:hypothetical protein
MCLDETGEEFEEFFRARLEKGFRVLFRVLF